MGFVTGLLGGVTLTTSLLYLTLAIHQRNRQEQSLLLRQSSLILRNVTDPLPPAPEPVAREARVSVLESAKDLWNREIEGVVRRVQYTDWSEVRERMERGAGRVLGVVKDEAEILGHEAGERIGELGDRAARTDGGAVGGTRILEEVARNSK